jgi:methyltransferase (TIGR00027 family)
LLPLLLSVQKISVTNRGSSTAFLIVATLVFLAEGRKQANLVDPESLAIGRWLLRNYSGSSRWIGRFIRTACFQFVAGGIEKLTVPGILEYFAVRKHAISRLANEAFDSDVQQLVVLGAGYDALAIKSVRKRDGVIAWEIDHPATQFWKRRAVNGTGLSLDRLHFVGKDFGEGFAGIELGADFSNKHSVFCVAEGLLMYLPEHRVIDLFLWLRQLTTQRCRVAFTFLEPQPDGRVDFHHRCRGIRAWLSAKREPFIWGIRREDLDSFLEKLGFRLLPIASEITDEMNRRCVGEFLALAESTDE